MEDSKDYEEFLDGFKVLAKQMEALNEQAYIAYKPLVDDICRRVATEKEVGWLLTWLLDFAGNDRMLGLYKQVCRAYWQKYPDSIAFYIMEYRKWYDPESLKGTKWEYLLNEDKDFEEE